MRGAYRFALALAATAVGLSAACGGSQPPPKVEDAPKEERRTARGPVPVVQQELGSIDEQAVKKTFFGLQDKVEVCHRQGRDRIEYLTGDVKVFLRIDGNGRVRYSYFEESTLGDRDTEKCILDVFARASWPKPVGGEAEVRNGFGWGSGGEREPSAWGPDKVVGALGDKEVKKELDACKAGPKEGFTVTGYVVVDDAADTEPPPPKPAPGKPTKKDHKPDKPEKADKERGGGKFQSVGVAVSSKEAANKIECVVSALKSARLPSPGSYAAKVTFGL